MKKVTITLAQWIRDGSIRFGEDRRRWKYECPKCGCIQTVTCLNHWGFQNPETSAYTKCFSCGYRTTGFLSRKYVKVKTPLGIIKVFPFSDTNKTKKND